MFKFRNPFKKKRTTKSAEQRGIPSQHEAEYMDNVDTEEENIPVNENAANTTGFSPDNYPYGLHASQKGMLPGRYRDLKGKIRAIGRK